MRNLASLYWSVGGFGVGFALGSFMTIVTGLWRISRSIQSQTRGACTAARAAQAEAAAVRELASEHYTKQEADHQQVTRLLNRVLGNVEE
jgi:hypothetical protein